MDEPRDVYVSKCRRFWGKQNVWRLQPRESCNKGLYVSKAVASPCIQYIRHVAPPKVHYCIFRRVYDLS